jgi:hypothetical protein
LWGGDFACPVARWPALTLAGSKFYQPASSMDTLATIAAFNQIPGVCIGKAAKGATEGKSDRIRTLTPSF